MPSKYNLNNKPLSDADRNRIDNDLKRPPVSLNANGVYMNGGQAEVVVVDGKGGTAADEASSSSVTDDDTTTASSKADEKPKTVPMVGVFEVRSEEKHVKLDDYSNQLRWRDVYYDEERDALTAEGQQESRLESRMQGITPQQQKDILALHNDLRRKEGGSNMYKLHWNEKLAKLGQQWSERCAFEHGQPPHDANSIGYKNIGQNIYAHTTTTFDVKQAVQAWYDEKPDYSYDSLTCKPGKVCGHYTAVTWGDTKEVGCGLAFCGSISGLTKAHFIVCNYGPPGNWGGEKPFLKGSACSKCGGGKFYCDNGLCDHTCKAEGPHCKCQASCKNGGQAKDCACTCKEGFMGADCGDPCKDLSPLCGANPGYPAPFCQNNDPNWAFVKVKCPKMCGKCKAKRSSDVSKSEGGDGLHQKSSLKRLISLLEDELHVHSDNR